MAPLRNIFYTFSALVIVITIGVICFIKLENMSFIDALWLVFVSITTVGFGDIVPSTDAGRLVTIFLIISGVGLFTYVLSAVFVGVTEGYIKNVWGQRKMLKKISTLENHIVVCGAGRVGKSVILELREGKDKFVIIEKELDRLEELRLEKEILFIAGDATEDKVLLSARVKHAKGVITTLPEDAGNLLITIACKDFNPAVRVVSRANRPESIIRLKRAGADIVICPSAIAGNRMALSVLKPASVAYVQSLIEEREIDLELEELSLAPGSSLAGKKIKDSHFREHYGIILLAIRRGNQDIISPKLEEELLPGDLLVLCGSSAQLARLEKLASGVT